MKAKKFDVPPTEFHRWWEAHPEWTDEKLSAATRELDRDNGICPRTVRRIRYGERSDQKGVFLLMIVTGLGVGDFLPREFLERLGRLR